MKLMDASHIIPVHLPCSFDPRYEIFIHHFDISIYFFTGKEPLCSKKKMYTFEQKVNQKICYITTAIQ